MRRTRSYTLQPVVMDVYKALRVLPQRFRLCSQLPSVCAASANPEAATLAPQPGALLLQYRGPTEPLKTVSSNQPLAGKLQQHLSAWRSSPRCHAVEPAVVSAPPCETLHLQGASLCSWTTLGSASPGCPFLGCTLQPHPPPHPIPLPNCPVLAPLGSVAHGSGSLPGRSPDPDSCPLHLHLRHLQRIRCWLGAPTLSPRSLPMGEHLTVLQVRPWKLTSVRCPPATT